MTIEACGRCGRENSGACCLWRDSTLRDERNELQVIENKHSRPRSLDTLVRLTRMSFLDSPDTFSVLEGTHLLLETPALACRPGFTSDPSFHTMSDIPSRRRNAIRDSAPEVRAQCHPATVIVLSSSIPMARATKRTSPHSRFAWDVRRRTNSTLRDSRISRQQAQIVSVNGALILEDCGSRHGTFVNGERILRHELQPNDKIEFGVADSYRLIYIGEGATIQELVDRVEAPAPTQPGARELHHLGVLLDVARALRHGPFARGHSHRGGGCRHPGDRHRTRRAAPRRSFRSSCRWLVARDKQRHHAAARRLAGFQKRRKTRRQHLAAN